jgi:hypothetical protein
MSTDAFPPFYNDLEATLARAIDLISDAAQRPTPFRTADLATHNPTGYPQVRALTLRAFDGEARCLTFFTDIRSPKLGQIEQDPRVSVVFYDPQERVQVRVDGTAQIENQTQAAREAWARVPEPSRKNYSAGNAPGSVLESINNLTGDPSTDGFENFALLKVNILALEWLYLHREGNRRAVFTWGQPGSPLLSPASHNWLVP